MTEGRKVFVAVPIYGGLDPFFSQCLIRLASNPPCNMALRLQAGDSLVARARNTLTADFLASDCTHLLFIDSDLVFGAEQIVHLVSHFEDPAVKIAGGCYPKKQQGDVQWVCNGCVEERQAREDGLLEVRYVGTGFMMIAREVFEAMIYRFGEELRYTPDHRKDREEYDFWSVGTYRYPDGSKRYLSEDWFFCQRWLDLDPANKVWMDTRVILKHVGTAVYPLDTQEQTLFGRHTVLPPDGTATAAEARFAPASAAHL